MAAKPDGAAMPHIFGSHSSLSGSPIVLILVGVGVVLVARDVALVAGGVVLVAGGVVLVARGAVPVADDDDAICPSFF